MQFQNSVLWYSQSKQFRQSSQRSAEYLTRGSCLGSCLQQSVGCEAVTVHGRSVHEHQQQQPQQQQQ